MSDAITPFQLAIPQADLDDLHQRLDRVRWPNAETVDDWSQGAPLNKVKALVDYWRHQYDWRRCETRLNNIPQFKTEIDGLGIHFMHIRSPHPDALPMIMTHGWPGSVIEFLDVIGPLTDPVAYGGDAKDAFHLVLPSLPGYGFSDQPTATGWSIEHTATAWGQLMQRLGYDRYVAQGGDWGSAVTNAMARQQPQGLAAIHLNMVIVTPPSDLVLSDEEKAMMKERETFMRVATGYSSLQATKPQTIGYALADSPVGQAAWIYEKFHGWTECNGEPETVLSKDQMLDNIMVYWLTNSGASSARMYWESFFKSFQLTPVAMPTACSIFPGEVIRPKRRWAEKLYTNIIHWSEAAKGGHFAAFEQPAIFTSEVRDAFRSLR